MAKEPLTAAGVQQKFSDLYALNDTQLNAEADLIASDFRQPRYSKRKMQA